jgi:hypothetical protein
MITVILVIPLQGFLSVILESYASIWPGTYDDEERFKASNNAKLNEDDVVRKSDFGEVINLAVQKDSVHARHNTGDAAQIAYSGPNTSKWVDLPYFL